MFDGHYLIASTAQAATLRQVQELLRQEPQERKDDILPPDARGGDNPPEHKEVLPLAPEPIRKKTALTKTTANAMLQSLVNDLRREHPHLKAIIVEDRPPY